MHFFLITFKPQKNVLRSAKFIFINSIPKPIFMFHINLDYKYTLLSADKRNCSVHLKRKHILVSNVTMAHHKLPPCSVISATLAAKVHPEEECCDSLCDSAQGHTEPYNLSCTNPQRDWDVSHTLRCVSRIERSWHKVLRFSSRHRKTPRNVKSDCANYKKIIAPAAHVCFFWYGATPSPRANWILSSH